MDRTRPRALVTTPVRGPGLDLLRELADLVIDPWIDHQPLRIYNAEQLAERAADEGATILMVEADRCAGPVFELPLVAVASTRGDPNNVDIEAATAAGVPVLRAPARNADAVAEIGVALLFAATRGVLGADRDVRAGEVYKDGTIPYQRFRAWQMAGRTAGLVGLGAVGRALRWRLEGLGYERRRLRPLRGRRHPQPRTAPRGLRRGVVARPGHRGDGWDDRGRAVRGHARRRGLPQHGARPAPRRRRPRRGAAVWEGRARRGSTTSSASTSPPTTPSRRSRTWCSPRTSGAPPTTPRSTTPRPSPTTSCRLLAGATPRNIVNPDVLKH